MKIALVCPHPPTIPTLLERYVTPPLGLQILAAKTPDKHYVKIIDERFRKAKMREHYDVIGITPIAASVPHAYKEADEYRKNGIKVIIGGYHASVLPEEAKQHADSVVLGEAEQLWPRILEDIKIGRLKPFYKCEGPLDPGLIPAAKRDASENRYLIAGIQATRGCPAGCKFCMIRKNEGIRFRSRPVQNVINEIENINNKRLVFFDASLTIDPKYSISLFKEMKSLNKKFVCNGTINVLSQNEELLKNAREAGCTSWFIGFESIIQKLS